MLQRLKVKTTLSCTKSVLESHLYHVNKIDALKNVHAT